MAQFVAEREEQYRLDQSAREDSLRIQAVRAAALARLDGAGLIAAELSQSAASTTSGARQLDIAEAPSSFASPERTHQRRPSQRRESLQRLGLKVHTSGDWRKIEMAALNNGSGLVGSEEAFDQLSRDEILQVFQTQFVQVEELKGKLTQIEEEQQSLVLENGQILRELEGMRNTNSELLVEQSKMEEELAGRIEVLDKLRSSVRELEREKRDSTKRYREQAESFESERQSWYDQEAHYKGRITNLTSATARRTPRSSLGARVSRASDEEDADAEVHSATDAANLKAPKAANIDGKSSPSSASSRGPSANELALQEQLLTLSTAHESLTTTLRTVQVELSDLKRVYQDLQEENESYEILLGERTLSGEVRGTDLFRRSFQWSEDDGGMTSPRGESLGFLGGLESVGEEEASDKASDEDDDDELEDDEELNDEDVERVLLESQGTGSPNEGAVQVKGTSKRRRKKASAASGSGGGLDLAAELEKAQSVDKEEEERKAAKAERRQASEARKAKAAAEKRRDSVNASPNISNEELHKEVKALREANKALTLYVSKIVDRVCSQEGFEKVLAVDYRNATPKAQPTAVLDTGAEEGEGNGVIKFRGGSSAKNSQGPPSPNPTSTAAGGKKRWSDAISSVLTSAISRSPSTPSSMPGMKPLRLSSDGSARKVSLTDEVEDEEDIRERERLRKEMARIGISGGKTNTVATPATGSSSGAGGGNNWVGKMPSGSERAGSARLSVGSTTSSGQSETQSLRSSQTNQTTPPTPKDLDAEVQEVLQLRVVKEKQAKEALEQGKASGFTEPSRRLSQRPASIVRHPSRSSVSYITGGANPIGVGLGIDAGLNGIAPSSKSSSPNPGSDPSTLNSPTVSATDSETPAVWSKTFKRLSMGWNPSPSG